jgi:hypothetical protein
VEYRTDIEAEQPAPGRSLSLPDGFAARELSLRHLAIAQDVEKPDIFAGIRQQAAALCWLWPGA